MRKIFFYHLENGKSPVTDFLESLSNKQVEKVFFVLDLIETIDIVPRKFLKKTPKKEIKIAEQRKKDYFSRRLS